MTIRPDMVYADVLLQLQAEAREAQQGCSPASTPTTSLAPATTARMVVNPACYQFNATMNEIYEKEK